MSWRVLAREEVDTGCYTWVAPHLGSDTSCFCQVLPTTWSTTRCLTHAAPPTVLCKGRHPHFCPLAPGENMQQSTEPCCSPRGIWTNGAVHSAWGFFCSVHTTSGHGAAGAGGGAGLPHTLCLEISPNCFLFSLESCYSNLLRVPSPPFGMELYGFLAYTFGHS